MILKLNQFYWSKNIKSLCGKPYYDKPCCPNYNKKDKCPPNSPDIVNLINVNEDIYLIYVEFDLEGHRNKMKIKHSDWTFRQLNCVLYWQGKVRADLKKEIKEFKKQFPKYFVDTMPEAHGVNITRIMLKHGIPIKWKYPLQKVYQVAIAGRNK